MLNSNHYEIICYRSRADQTLYISELINVGECSGYGQLHVGLYIAAIRDARDRALQLEHSKPLSWSRICSNQMIRPNDWDSEKIASLQKKKFSVPEVEPKSVSRSLRTLSMAR